MTRRTDKRFTAIRGMDRTFVEITWWRDGYAYVRANEPHPVTGRREAFATLTPAGLRKLQRDIGRHLSRLEKKR